MPLCIDTFYCAFVNTNFTIIKCPLCNKELYFDVSVCGNCAFPADQDKETQ